MYISIILADSYNYYNIILLCSSVFLSYKSYNISGRAKTFDLVGSVLKSYLRGVVSQMDGNQGKLAFCRIANSPEVSILPPSSKMLSCFIM